MICGVFSRWAVVTKHDGAPIEGCVYTHKDKASRRMRGMSNPERFDVRLVFVMNEETVEEIIRRLANADKNAICG